MHVAVDDARRDGGAAQVDELGRAVRELADLGVVADRDDLAVRDGDRGRARARGVERADPPADEREVDACHAPILPVQR